MVLIFCSDVKGIDMVLIRIDTCRYRKVSILVGIERYRYHENDKVIVIIINL